MKRFWKSQTVAASVGLALVIVFFSRIAWTETKDGDAGPSAPSTSDKLIVHEWGTFTSFSGSNGVQLDFRPLVDVDLPNFVFDYELHSGEPNFSKGRIRARVRMETPVTYFYTDKERTVHASVEFPDGLLTEFYPPVSSLTPQSNPRFEEHPKLAGGKLDWGEIHLIPAAAMAPAVKNDGARDWLHNLISQRILPHEGAAANHYYHARETDSAFVHVHRPASDGAIARPASDHIEKFLFYRGVGRFEQPLKVIVDEAGTVRVTNQCPQAIRSLIRVTIAGQSATISELAQVKGGQTVVFPAAEKSVTIEELQQVVVNALTHEDLYPREALAMVKTWADSWFAEEGTRIFYMVPRQTTDRLLPLKISPRPDETVRVLVGRVEVMSPSMERDLLELVRLRAMQRQTIAKRNAEQNLNDPIELSIPTRFKKLGRLAEPALVRLRQLASDTNVSNEAEILMRECQTALQQNPNEGDVASTGSE